MDIIRKNWFLAVFIFILVLPLYGKFLDSNITLNGVSTSVNSVEATIDTLSDGTYQSYINGIWEEEFPGRKFLLRVRNQLLYSICKVSPNSNVVIGKDDYLYEPSYILFETQAFAPSSEEYFNTLGENLEKINMLLESYGKELYVFVTPSKAHFYKDFIPDLYLCLDKEDEYSYTNYSKLIEELDANDIKYFDSIKFVEDNYNSGILSAPLFYKTGIHWSQPWGETCAAEFVNYMNDYSKYNLAQVEVSESRCDKPVHPATDLYSSLNLIRNAQDEWWTSEMTVVREGKDKPKVFCRGGSFMGQSLSALVRGGVFGEDVVFENYYYFQNQYSEHETLSSFTSYDEIDLNKLLGKSDILILEVNEGAISTMSWGFIEYLLAHPECLDYNLDEGLLSENRVWTGYSISIDGSIATEENPWGYTAGIIDVEALGECVLLYPNTSFTIENLGQESVINTSVMIHPWVAEYSDGAGVLIWIMDDDNNIIDQQEVDIDADSGCIDISIPLIQYESASKIRFMCNNGQNNDDSCDWVIFTSNITN